MIDKPISIIVPCYNEEQVIRETHLQLSNVLKKHFNNYEVIFVNDGSKDNTLNILNKLAKEDKHLKIINFSRNFGHQPAVSAGIDNCSGDYAIIMDADLQDPPQCIPDMVALAIAEQANVVYGVRKTRKGETLFKKITAKYFYQLLNYFSEINIPIDTGDFRLIDKKIIKQYKKLKERNKFIRGLISWIGYKQIPFFYDRDARLAGETHYPFTKMFAFAIKGLLYFSKHPLYIAINIGLSCVVLSVLYFLVFVVLKLTRPEMVVQGWTSLVGLLVLLGGLQLLGIGLIGVYIGNMFDEIKARPEYIIDDIDDDIEN
jgi:glycosyltransferase involved in cell wall biosynthesis